MKKSAFFVLTVAIFFTMQLAAKLEDKIIVIVNNEIITQSELDEAINLLDTQLKLTGKEPGKEDEKDTKDKMLQNLIEQKLIITMAKDESIEVSDEAVADKANDFIDNLRNKFGSESEFEDALAKEGMSYSDFRIKIEAQVRDNLIFTKVKQKKQQDFIAKAAVSDEEIKKYFSENKDDFKTDDEVNISQIFFDKVKAGNSDIKKKAGDTYSKLQTGVKFEDVIKEMKSDKTVAAGELGWIDTTNLDESVKKAVAKLKKGAFSSPIETNNGYLIVKLVDSKGGKDAVFEDIRDKVRIKVIEGKVEKMWDEWTTKAKEQAYIKYMDK